MQNLMITLSKTLQIKLKRLASFLLQVNKGFDNIAEEIEDTNLKTALQALSVESCQYAKEINNELLHLEISVPVDFKSNQMWKEIEISITDEQCSMAKGGEIAALCESCEIYFTKLYKETLEEFFPEDKLKDIITYQLYAIQLAFMKIKLLNTLRFNHQ
jgi:hypothetical protein